MEDQQLQCQMLRPDPNLFFFLDYDWLTPLSFAHGRTFRNKEARNGGRKAVDLIHTENQGRTAIPWRT